jgi:hypothetical protein
MDASVKRVLQQNRRAAHELQLHIEQSTLLHKENKILMEERRQLMQARPSTCSSVAAPQGSAHQLVICRDRCPSMQCSQIQDLVHASNRWH